MARIGYSRRSSIAHIAQPRTNYYSGETATALCGTKVNMTDKVASTHPDRTHPVGTCKRCAAALGQKVKQA